MGFLKIVKALKNISPEEYIYETENARLIFRSAEIDYDNKTLILCDKENGTWLRTEEIYDAEIYKHELHTSIHMRTASGELMRLWYLTRMT